MAIGDYPALAAAAATAGKSSTPAKSEPALKVEKPMLDTTTLKPETPKLAPAPSASQQSPSGYFIPPDVINSGTPPSSNGDSGQYQQAGPASGSYGGGPSGPRGGSFPAMPNEGAIPEFGKPLPAMPAQAMGSPGQFGQGWGTGPSQSSDDARVGRLEKAVLGSTYPEHDLIDRVEHLEEEVFKTKGSGQMEDRLKKMETTVFGQSGAAFGGQNGAPPAVSQSGSMPMPSMPPASQSMPPHSMPTMSRVPTDLGPPTRAPYELSPYPSQSSSQPNYGGPPGGMGGAPQGVPPGGMPGGGSSAMTNGMLGGIPNGLPGGTPGGAPPAYRPPYQGSPSGNGAPPNYPNQYGAPAAQPQPYVGQPSYGFQPPGTGYPPNQMAQMPPNYSAGTPYNPGGNRFAGNPNGAMGGAPYTPPSNQYPYGAPQQNYGYRAPNNPSIPVQGNPGNQGNLNGPNGANPQYRPPQSGGSAPVYGRDPESQRIAGLIVADPKAGDYYPSIRKFQNGTVARWQHFPVLVHLPASTPESWHKSLTEDVKKWAAYIPLKSAADYESFVIDVKWENKLPPQVFGITRVEGSGAGLKVIIFLLRPTFYPPDVPETTLQSVFLHELGHALGLYGHSLDASDVMYIDEKSAKRGAPKVNTISPRDLNTLKRVYSTPPISDTFVIQPPLEYTAGTRGNCTQLH